MKVLKQVLKENLMELKVENEEDLWHLSFILEIGDLIKMKSFRTSSVGKEKVPCVLKLRVEKISYEGKRIRTTGKILEGPEKVEAGYHTFNIEENSFFLLWKENWKKYQKDRIKKAIKDKKYKILACLIEKEDVSFYVITEMGIKFVGEKESEIPGKMFKGDKSENEFFGEVIASLKSIESDKIILAGPGFEKENLARVIKDKEKELKNKIFVQNTSVTGKTGVTEIIKRGAIEKIVKESRISSEINLVEKFLELLSKNKEVSYGLKEVQRAIVLGAVKDLLISENKIREKGVITLMGSAEKNRAEIHIIHVDHDSGRQLESLGGIAAILRFKI